MAILMRRGASTNFYASRMTPGEFAIDTDTGEVHYCYQAGQVKTLATKEELQQILDDSPEAYEALQELISALDDQTVLSGILSDITNLKTTMGSTDISQIGNGTVTGALSFLNEGNNVVFLTMDEYNQLPDSKLTDGIIYYITDADGLGAQNISYDNSTSGINGNTVQAAVDELAGDVSGLEDDVSELNGKLLYTRYNGTGCTIFYSDAGSVLIVNANVQNVVGGNVNTNVIGSLPDNITITGGISGAPVNILDSSWVPFDFPCCIFVTSGYGGDITVRINGQKSVTAGVCTGIYFIPPYYCVRQTQ